MKNYKMSKNRILWLNLVKNEAFLRFRQLIRQPKEKILCRSRKTRDLRFKDVVRPGVEPGLF